MEKVETLVIGCGQAGIAMSEHLSAHGKTHLVLERDRIAESWRSRRWDALVANGPAWHDRFPGMTFDDIDPDSFASKDRVVRYFVDYARKYSVPVREGVDVKALRHSSTGFQLETTAGDFSASNVVVATGAFQKPVIPNLVPAESGILQIHSHVYQSPKLLPEGAILVVGAGSSGAQIAHELLRSGRKVYLCVGPHNKPPRWYRGKDYCWWLGKTGHWQEKVKKPGTEHITIAVSGAYGGHTVDFRKLAEEGMVLLGMAKGFSDGKLHLAPDLKQNLQRGDADYLSVLDAADEIAKCEGLDLPLDPDARKMTADPDCVTHPILDLDVRASGINTIIWATGYTSDFSWIKCDAFDALGRPAHNNGVSKFPGLYFLGLPWLSNRSSSFIWGVWNDAKFLAEHIARNRSST